MTLAILFSLKTKVSLQNEVATHFQVTSLFSTRTDLLPLGTAELRWNFSSWLRDTPDIYRFPEVHIVLLENLWISGASWGILE